MTPLPISHYTLVSALGAGRDAHACAYAEGRGGLRQKPFDHAECFGWIGEVDGLDVPLAGELGPWDCRNNRLAELGLQQDGFLAAAAALKAHYGAARVGVFLGTSTSGVQATERAYRERDRAANVLPSWFDYRRTQNTFSLAHYVQQRLGLTGVANCVSTACSSSAKVFASAARAIAAGQCDAAVVGGVDSLCLTTLYGFRALQLVSPEPCRPSDATRTGISIGEAAAFALLDPNADLATAPHALLGYGESSDAHHMSAPEPEGRGAEQAMRAALERAGAAPDAVDWLHLHGTATPANDLAEDKGANRVFGEGLARSSTKGFYGHTLGAAGMVGVAAALIAMEQGLLPQSLNTRERDPAIAGNVLLAPQRGKPVRKVMTNAFGFGGNNCALLIGRRDDAPGAARTAAADGDALVAAAHA